MMKVAVIGASGFIGTRLIEQFRLAGEPIVTAVVHRPSSLALPSRFALETHVADALDREAVIRAIAGCTAVIHAAIGDPMQIERMPTVLCEAAAAANIRRLVYLSSASVHGQNPAPGTDEGTPLDLHQLLEYNRAKIRAEQRFFAECQKHSLCGFALRPSVVYGPRSRWIADLASDLLEGRAWLFDEGRGVCNGIYVDNLVQAVRCCLEANDDHAGAYLVNDTETVTWGDFYRSVALHLDVPYARIHQITQLPAFKQTWRDRADRAAAHPFVQRLLPLVPFGLKRSAKAVIAAASPTPRPDSWSLPNGPRPRITQELALLQQCRWKLPHIRAERLLGYRPVVSFANGMERSFAWWHFAQGKLPAAA